MEDIPFEFNYEKLKPKGWYTNYRDFIVTPMSSNNVWNSGDIVRFLFTTNEGVMDPYRSYIEIEVQVPAQICPVGGLYVDNSAQNFIAQSVISSRGVEVERIQAYNFLAAYLNDINFSEYVCENREVEGLGYTNYSYNENVGVLGGPNNGTKYFQSWNETNKGPIYTEDMSNLISPTRMTAFPKIGETLAATNYSFKPGIANSNHLSNLNWLWRGPGNGVSPNSIMSTTGLSMNVRAEYKTLLTNNVYPDVSNSILPNATTLQPILNLASQTNFSLSDVNIQTGGNYILNPIPEVNLKSWISNGTATQYSTAANSPTYFGYNTLFAPPFCKGSFEPLISPTIPQCQMQNGQILASKVPVATKRFKIPLISSIIGILIDPSQFLLIPMAALQNLQIELTLNPFALVSTGYQDYTEVDSVGMKTQIPRKYIISNINYHIDLYLFYERENKQYIIESLNKEIFIGATSWTLGSQFQIPNGQVIANAWPTSSTAEFMNEIVTFFIPNDYQLWSFCRQQYRLSANITSYQIRFNSEFYPPQPIVGNGGNPEILDSTGDNSPFLTLLLKSLDYLFSTNYPNPKINKFNFAINCRGYDPTAQETFYPAIWTDNFNPDQYPFPPQEDGINDDTAMGMPYIHENRFVGKAAYVYTWEPYGHSKGAIHGINANLARPFEIILNVAPEGYFSRDQTMYNFIRSSIIVRYSNEGVSVIGK